MAYHSHRWVFCALAMHVVNFRFPGLRAQSSLVNHIVAVVVPAVAFWMLARAHRRTSGGLGGVVAAVLGAGVLASPGIVGLLREAGGSDRCECIAALDAGGSTVAAYRCDDLGATGDWSVEVRQEKDLLAGLRLEKPVISVYHARTAILAQVQFAKVSVTVPVAGHAPYEHDVALRRFLWF